MAVDAPAPVRIESLDGIPDVLHAQFVEVEHEGAKLWEHRPPPVKTVADVERVQTALKKERERANQLAEQLKQAPSKLQFGDEEVDVEELGKLWTERKQQTGKEMIARADVEKEKAELREKVQGANKKEIEARETRIVELESTLNRVLIDEGIARLSADSSLPFKLREKSAALLITLARAHNAFKVIDGQPVPMDGDRPMETAKGDPATMADWIIAKATEYNLVEASQGTGAGPAATNGIGAAPKRKLSEMTVEEKSQYISKHGDIKFLELLGAKH